MLSATLAAIFTPKFYDQASFVSSVPFHAVSSKCISMLYCAFSQSGVLNRFSQSFTMDVKYQLLTSSPPSLSKRNLESQGFYAMFDVYVYLAG